MAKRRGAVRVPESLAAHSPEQLTAIIVAQGETIQELWVIVQQLRDEVARLKGEHGMPRVRPQVRQDRSSEGERPREATPLK